MLQEAAIVVAAVAADVCYDLHPHQQPWRGYISADGSAQGGSGVPAGKQKSAASAAKALLPVLQEL